jgi:hypothetical protein
MPLLDLPPEIFDPIIHALVKSVGVAEAVKCRQVFST